MHNTQEEDLMQHTAETAFIAHHLALIGTTYFNKTYNVDKIATCALYHDVAEVFTGDLPTPIKYFNDEMRSTYGQIERTALDKLVSSLPVELQESYRGYLKETALSEPERALIKTADKLCAYIKCKREIAAGNKEFEPAYDAIKTQLDEMQGDELSYFLENCLDEFTLSLDNLGGTL